MMRRWQYWTVRLQKLEKAASVRTLNEAGQNGWEVVGIAQDIERDGTDGWCTVLFKRELLG